MRKFNLFAVAIAMLTMISCSKESDAPSIADNGEKMAVTLRLAPQGTLSKSIETPAIDNDKINLVGGLVFFITTSGSITDVGDLIPAQAQLPAGQPFPGISKSATEVYIVANSSTLTAGDEAILRSSATKNGLKAAISSIKDQQNTHKQVVAVNAIDAINFPTHDGKITVDGVDPNKFKACVLLAPVLSRIQIADILTTDVNIISFKFASIDVDGYYPSYYMALNKGGAGTKFTVNQDGTLLSQSADKLYDKPAAPVADGGDKKITALEAKGGTGDFVWAYQTSPTTGGATDVPRIVVKFSEIVLKNPDGGANIVISDPKYLTVTGYKAGTAQVVNFESGKIYSIPTGGFTFKYQDLDDTPNPLKKTVDVCVAIKPWTVVSVTPQL